MTFKSRNRRRPRRASAEPIVPKERSGAGPTGDRAARTRIPGIDSRKRIGPSARGRRRIRRRSAIATSRATLLVGHANRVGIAHGRTNPAPIDPGASARRTNLIVRGRSTSERTSHAGVHPNIARAEAKASGPPSLAHGATNLPVRRARIDRGRTSPRERLAGTRSRRAPASGPGAENRATQAVRRRLPGNAQGNNGGRRPAIVPAEAVASIRRSRGTESPGATNRRRPMIDRGRQNRRARERSGSRGPASRRATRCAAIGRGRTNRWKANREAIDRGPRSRRVRRGAIGRGPRRRRVRRGVTGRGPRSRRVRHEAIGRGAERGQARAIGSRGKRNRSDRAVRPSRIHESAARTRASAATMNRPIATDVGRRLSGC